jgi:hypothetical protein
MRGRALSEAWWTKVGRNALFADKFQNGVYALHMKNRFKWAEKSEHELNGRLTLTHEQLLEQLDKPDDATGEGITPAAEIGL